jgi:hypothetical protein
VPIRIKLKVSRDGATQSKGGQVTREWHTTEGLRKRSKGGLLKRWRPTLRPETRTVSVVRTLIKSKREKMARSLRKLHNE